MSRNILLLVPDEYEMFRVWKGKRIIKFLRDREDKIMSNLQKYMQFE